MSLKEEMYSMIEQWRCSGQSKRDFISDKPISIHKFGYWLSKYNKESYHEVFKELQPPKSVKPTDVKKVLELTTSSGVRVTIFE